MGATRAIPRVEGGGMALEVVEGGGRPKSYRGAWDRPFSQGFTYFRVSGIFFGRCFLARYRTHRQHVQDAHSLAAGPR